MTEELEMWAKFREAWTFVEIQIIPAIPGAMYGKKLKNLVTFENVTVSNNWLVVPLQFRTHNHCWLVLTLTDLPFALIKRMLLSTLQWQNTFYHWTLVPMLQTPICLALLPDEKHMFLILYKFLITWSDRFKFY